MKPIWKSVGFWLGAMVLAFLLWAWGDSMRNVSMGSRSDAIQSITIYSGFSRLGIERTQELFDGWNLSENPTSIPDPYYWDWTREESGGLGRRLVLRNEVEHLGWFPRFFRVVDVDDEGTRVMDLEVPYWMVSGGYSAVWLCGLFLFRRWQRKWAAQGGS